MKIKKLIAAVPAVCLLLAAFGTIHVGAVDAGTVTSGAVVEVYSGQKLQSTTEYGSPAEAWTRTVSSADSSSETVITLGADWNEDEILTIKSGQHITLDLNGHYVKRSRNYSLKSDGAVFHINSSGVFTLRDSNPKSKGYDGVKGGVITGGASSNTGGGVHIDEDGEFRMEGGTIYDCITDEDGGAVYLDGSSMNTKFTMTGGRIYGCKTIDSANECYGGAIYLRKGTVAISNAKIDDCYSEDDGGAIYSERGKITLNNVIFSGNKCREKGGAIYIAHDTAKYQATLLHVYDCIFAGNQAEEDGGAVFINDNAENNEAVLFHNCQFRNNNAAGYGGAIYVNDDNIALSSCEITANRAGQPGGGVFVDCRYDITLKGQMIIKDNFSEKGKGVSNLALDNGTLGTSHVINGGLYKNSIVHVGSTASKSVLLSEWMSQYQAKYFAADEGTLMFHEQRVVEAPMIVTASLFSEGGFKAVIILGSVGVIGTIILIIRKKSTHKAVQGNEEAVQGGEEND